MSLRSPIEHENAALRHAGMDCRHLGSQDASGDIHFDLDSSTPYWNDAIEGALVEVTEVPLPTYFRRSRDMSLLPAVASLELYEPAIA